MTSHTLLGNRILVQLDPHPDHTTLTSGVIVPDFRNVESDGGRPMAKASNKKHTSTGTVLNLSSTAQKLAAEDSNTLQVGDKVLVAESAVSQQYHFALNRENLVRDFDGLISIPYQLIEAKITNGY